ncbi:hypothetical protein D3C87_1599810 [compost metagenome]
MPAGAGIERGAVGIGSGGIFGDFGAGAEAGIKEVHVAQPVGDRGIDVEAFGLDQHGLGPGEAQPRQVLEDGLGKFGFTALDVDVFDAQKRFAPQNLGGLPGHQSREGMAEMEKTIGAGRKAENGFGHEPERNGF